MLKYTLKNFPSQTVMYRKILVCLCRHIFSTIHIIFNVAVHFISDMISMNKFQHISKICTRVRACKTNLQTDRETNGIHKYFVLFCLQSIKNHGTQFKIRYLYPIRTVLSISTPLISIKVTNSIDTWCNMSVKKSS